MIVVVLIADLVRSREIPARAEFQLRLKTQLDRLSRDAAERLHSPFTLTLGDEFQAVYRDFRQVLPDLIRLQAGIAPVRVRFALAAGTLSTAINPERALEMDGPAFLAARELLEVLKKQHRSVIQTSLEQEPQPVLANAGLGLLCGAMGRWKPVTLRIFHALLQGRSVEAIAGELGLSSRGVYKQLAGHQLQEARTLLLACSADLEEQRLRHEGNTAP